MKDLSPSVQNLIAETETKPFKHRLHSDRIEILKRGENDFRAAHPSYPEVEGRGRTAQDAIDEWYIKIGTTWHPQRFTYVFEGIEHACAAWLKAAQNSERGEVVANIMEIEAFVRAFKEKRFK